ncbi:FAD-binding domain-containing protein [Macrolepiota fuliginosa MF-IS2]|uniref:FAD-binding domain-containing protein n=1 Tax=Macrolepiota fuliginosa MF-IS2 TaxID=1400762 RepID=A0A9P6C3V6_9AGAR|nr:FAD-binding domain-containing protein [Macrolepiota fuliginosa MF-IS2]
MRFELFYDLVAFLPSILAQTSTCADPSGCRCVYGQYCWPSERDFDSLSAQLSVPLIRPIPPASACYPVGNPSGNCSDVQQNWSNGIWRSDQPGAYEFSNFETYTNSANGSVSGCYLNTTLGLPCEQGSVAPVGVDARTVGDVQAAVRFAGEYNLRLVVKNTGHDLLGRSAARGAFMIWTHHLKNISYDANFIPEGGSDYETVPALTLGAGVQWKEAYAAASEQQRYIMGGISDDMSNGAAGGWVMGGGHGPLSPKYGLGVDNVVQFTIVTPNGDHVVANAYRHSDLFWALRGGGAGSWGVVTSATYRTYDLVPLVLVSMNATFPDSQAAQRVTTELVRLQPKLSDAGWGGFSSFNNVFLSLLFLAPDVSWAEVNTTILPFFNFVGDAAGPSNVEILTKPFDNFYAWLNTLTPSGLPQVGVNWELASRLMSRDMAENHTEESAQLLLSFDFISLVLVAGGVVGRADPDSVGLNPGWRKAAALAVTVETWKEGASSSVVFEARQRIAEYVRRLEPISPDSATYMNEASLYEPDFRKSFFGSHYNRLRSIKRKYDPTSTFLVVEGVGSEDWNGDLTCPL